MSRLYLAPLLLVLAAPAAAVDYVVTTESAASDPTPGDGVCESRWEPGECSLRAALQEANARPGFDRVILPAGHFRVRVGGVDAFSDTDADGDLDVTDDVEILGAGMRLTVIDGNRVGNLLEVRDGAVASLVGLTLTGGYADPTGFAVDYYHCGGLTVFRAEAQLRDVRITENVGYADALDWAGSPTAGLCVEESTLLAVDSLIDRNSARASAAEAGSGPGAILAYDSEIRFERCAILDNDASAFGYGGASAGASGAGLGIFVSDAEFVNCTIAGNTVFTNDATVQTARGGAAYIGDGSSARFSNCTITDNWASVEPGGDASAGGIWGPATLSNTILAENGAPREPNCGVAAVESLGWNLIDDTAGCTLTGAGTGDLLGVPHLLGALSDNGGPTATHLPLPSSPAIDAGDPSGCSDSLAVPLMTDQRSTERVLDGDGDGTPRCDIGAVEVGPCTEPSPVDLGEPVALLVSKSASGDLALSWSRAAPMRFELHRGTLPAGATLGARLAGSGEAYDHVPVTEGCDLPTNGGELSLRPGNSYFLALSACEDGSRSSPGRDSDGLERPDSAQDCS